MLYFREKEIEKLNVFFSTPRKKAMAIYGRRRTGKTKLVTDYIAGLETKDIVYYQVASFDYTVALGDFKNALKTVLSDNPLIDAFVSFKDIFAYLSETKSTALIKGIIIDEFPFLAKKNPDIVTEFQWIIDHGLGSAKLILLGSNRSFMKKQISDTESPLYGRFDEIIEILPFSFENIQTLFPKLEDAVDVYAQTGGVAQYVMMFREYPSVKEATAALFFDNNGRLFREAENLLLQELRDVTTYTSVLRALGGASKEAGQLAKKVGIDARGVFTYLAKLVDLGLVETLENALPAKGKGEKRYRIADMLFRFNFTFIAPNVSMITAIGSAAVDYVLGSKYNEYLGFVYEEIIASRCFKYALEGGLPFMPTNIGKWWGNVKENGDWHESEIDLVAFDDHNVVLGECKYKNKQIGFGELDNLRLKAAFIPIKDRKIYFLLASKSGFTNEIINLRESLDNLVLIDGV